MATSGLGFPCLAVFRFPNCSGLGQSHNEPVPRKCRPGPASAPGRSASSRALGSAVDPPSVWPAFNGQTLLIQPVQQRGQRQAVVQSGTVPPTHSASSTDDPWANGDPWQTYRVAHGMPMGTKAGPASTAREVVGPTEKRFQDQDSRLSVLERTLSEVQSKQEAFRAEVQKNREADMQSVTQQMSNLGVTMGKVQQDLAQQLQTSYASLVAAQAQQQAQLQSGVDELKAMLGATNATNKRHKAEEDVP